MLQNCYFVLCPRAVVKTAWENKQHPSRPDIYCSARLRPRKAGPWYDEKGGKRHFKKQMMVLVWGVTWINVYFTVLYILIKTLEGQYFSL